MLKSQIHNFSQFFRVQKDKPELLVAQSRVFSGQLPLMYFMLLTNTWILSLLFVPHAPTWLALYIPGFFTVICFIRLFRWWKSRLKKPTPENAYKELRRTNYLSAIIGIAFTAWALALMPYGNELLKSNIAFYMSITGIGVIFCLMNLRSAALNAMLIINISFVLYFGLLGIPTFTAMAINILLVSVALMMILNVQYQNFVETVEAKTKLEAISAENFRLSNLDSLTDLPNRRQFFRHLRSAFTSAEKNSKRLAVGVLDLDGFKPVNDLYGHSMGDNLLKEVGRRLAKIADKNIHISRLGGDEFALIIKDFEDDKMLLSVGEQVCEALRVPIVLTEATVQISGSIGLAVYPELATNYQELYERADYALYEGKRQKRGHAVLFSDKHADEIMQHSKVEQELRNADLENELSVFFQPIIDVNTQKVVAFEALARWCNPVLGSVSPGNFISVAERAGIISDLTQVLLTNALRIARTWPDHIRLSFNLSAHDIKSSRGVLRVFNIIQLSGFDPKRLDLEITETAMMYDFTQTSAAIEMLKKLGCGIVLDDFGTGYSSLTQLHALPLTKIKIDRSFVTNLDNKPASYKIVKSLLALSNDMQLGCVVEGVETEAEITALKDIGGELIQGYFYAQPMPEHEVLNFLSDTKIASNL